MTSGFSLERILVREETTEKTIRKRGVLDVVEEERVPVYRHPAGFEIRGPGRREARLKFGDPLVGQIPLGRSLAERFLDPKLRQKALQRLGVQVQGEGRDWVQGKIWVPYGLKGYLRPYPLTLKLVGETTLRVEVPRSLSDEFNEQIAPLILLGTTHQLFDVGQPHDGPLGTTLYAVHEGKAIALTPQCEEFYGHLATQGANEILKPSDVKRWVDEELGEGFWVSGEGHRGKVSRRKDRKGRWFPILMPV